MISAVEQTFEALSDLSFQAADCCLSFFQDLFIIMTHQLWFIIKISYKSCSNRKWRRMTWYWVVTQAAACSSSIESVHESSMMNHQFNRFRKTEVCFSDENSRILFHDHLITFCYTIRGILKWFNIIKVVFKVLFHVYSWIFSTFHPIVILGTSVERYQGFHGQGRVDWNDGLVYCDS